MHSRGYEDGTGSSGYTYKHGVLSALKRLSPAIFLFENVIGVCDRFKTADGVTTLVEAGLQSSCIFVAVCTFCYVTVCTVL